jgi:23S rRNA pseudouridine2605 synthase
MRLNKFVARASGISRREADDLIARGDVTVGGAVAILGSQVDEASDAVALKGKLLTLPPERTLIMLNKPVGYVSSRAAQATDAKTLYELLPETFQRLKTVGRLDKDSSGLILLTDDGDLAFQMTHPKFAKTKVYLVELDTALEPLHQQMISDVGIALPDGNSRLLLERLDDDRRRFRVTMSEGRNRQIRRTFAALGYTVKKLHRTNFGSYALDDLKSGKFREVN